MHSTQARTDLFPDGRFDNPLSGWAGRKVRGIFRDTDVSLFGAASLYVGSHFPYQSKIHHAGVDGPSVRLAAGKDYAFGFAVKSPIARPIQAQIGMHTQTLHIPKGWFQHVMRYCPTSTGAHQIKFNTGMTDAEIWFADLRLFEDTPLSGGSVN